MKKKSSKKCMMFLEKGNAFLSREFRSLQREDSVMKITSYFES